MSKPILSELDYNASDVASAILSQADLSVTNEDFGVTDRTSLFTVGGGFSVGNKQAFSFNGFMFISASFARSSTPGGSDALLSISDSDFYPINNTVFPTVSYEGDTAEYLTVSSSTGEFTVSAPENVSASAYYGVFNGWYRFT